MTGENETEMWQKSPKPIRYNLPETCPFCGDKLKAKDVYVGIFPYIYTDFTLVCWANPEHKFNFCFPYNRAMAEGYTVFDDTEFKRYSTERKCPFHGERLKPIRVYGNLTFKDGTKKVQLRCPICNYSERVSFKKS
jgi:hypothetical protein